jgi:hypothetical protein
LNHFEKTKVINSQLFISAPDPYCFMKCEGETLKGPVFNNSLNPTWKQFSAVFYRKQMTSPIKIQVRIDLSI